MTTSRGRSAATCSAAIVRIGTKLSGFTQACVYFALMSSAFMPRTDESEASMPGSERIWPGTTPTTAASTNVASSVPSRATMRPRDVGSRVMRTSRPAVRCGRIASGVQSIFHAALSLSPTSTRFSAVCRATSPTRCVWKVTSSVTVARRGSGEPFASAGCEAAPVRASSDFNVISSAMRGRRSTNPAAPTRCCASSLTSAHMAW